MSITSRVWLRARRLERNMRQSDVFYKTQNLGAAVPESVMAKLENGRLGLLDITAAQALALRRVLEISDAEWEALVTPTERAGTGEQ